MRRDSTGAENVMWQILRGRRFAGVKFRRQVPFRNFILDFVCFENSIAIEIDGSQHAESVQDKRRDELVRAEGFEVLRYWNSDVLANPRSVQEDIWAKLHETDPSPGASLRSAPPSPARGEGKSARGEA